MLPSNKQIELVKDRARLDFICKFITTKGLIGLKQLTWTVYDEEGKSLMGRAAVSFRPRRNRQGHGGGKTTKAISPMNIDLTKALWCDLETDLQRANWLRLGRGYETGVIAKSIQHDLAMAFEFRYQVHTNDAMAIVPTRPMAAERKAT